MQPARNEMNELLDLFDEMLQLSVQQLEWFAQNTPVDGDIDQLLALLGQRQKLMSVIDERLQQGKAKGENWADQEGLSPLIEKILNIDNRLQEKALSWMHDLKGKMQQGSTIRKANRAYGGDVPNYKPAFFDGKR
ncbi:MAG: flagellar protein FliT [Methylocystaceae bacterium]